MSKWICVKSGLPESCNVLCTISRSGMLWVEIGIWHFGKWVGANCEESSKRVRRLEDGRQTVTHWMVLPEPHHDQ